MKSKDVLIFDDWYAIHGEEVSIKAAETGADREMDFNPDAWMEEHYEQYLRDCWKKVEAEAYPRKKQ
jgi:hypothetical protein